MAEAAALSRPLGRGDVFWQDAKGSWEKTSRKSEGKYQRVAPCYVDKQVGIRCRLIARMLFCYFWSCLSQGSLEIRRQRKA